MNIRSIIFGVAVIALAMAGFMYRQLSASNYRSLYSHHSAYLAENSTAGYASPSATMVTASAPVITGHR